MSRSSYIFCAVILIVFGTFMNYAMLDDDGSTSARNYGTGHVGGGYLGGGYSGGHK